jgi:hypothetical protein
VVLGSFALWKGANVLGDGQAWELGGGLALTLTRVPADPIVGIAATCRRSDTLVERVPLAERPCDDARVMCSPHLGNPDHAVGHPTDASPQIEGRRTYPRVGPAVRPLRYAAPGTDGAQSPEGDGYRFVEGPEGCRKD